MILSIYSQYVVSDPFERIGPTMVFSFMLIGRLVIYYQVSWLDLWPLGVEKSWEKRNKMVATWKLLFPIDFQVSSDSEERLVKLPKIGGFYALGSTLRFTFKKSPCL